MKFSCASIVILMLALAGCSENIRTSHPTLIDAKSDIEKGWIPSVLPASTVKISESHDLDLNTGHGTFSFGQADAKEFKKSLAAISDNESLSGTEINQKQLKQEGFELYKIEGFYLAVNWTQCCGQFWLNYSR